MTKDQSDILKKAIESVTTAEDYEEAKQLEAMTKHPGWEVFQKIFESTKQSIWARMQTAKKEDNVWRLMGMMEGHEIAARAALKWIEFMQERDKKTEVHVDSPTALDHIL